jgi:hypothetical protein
MNAKNTISVKEKLGQTKTDLSRYIVNTCSGAQEIMS